jgi:hypothetical protein
MNLFRCGTPDGSLDKKYLRVCSVYRMLKRGLIGKSRALELLAQRHTESEMKKLRGTVELWRAGPLKNMGA